MENNDKDDPFSPSRKNRSAVVLADYLGCRVIAIEDVAALLVTMVLGENPDLHSRLILETTLTTLLGKQSQLQNELENMQSEFQDAQDELVTWEVREQEFGLCVEELQEVRAHDLAQSLVINRLVSLAGKICATDFEMSAADYGKLMERVIENTGKSVDELIEVAMRPSTTRRPGRHSGSMGSIKNKKQGAVSKKASKRGAKKK